MGLPRKGVAVAGPPGTNKGRSDAPALAFQAVVSTLLAGEFRDMDLSGLVAGIAVGADPDVVLAA